VNAFAIGACDYLLKPFTAERLAQTVTRLLARRPKIKTARAPALTPPDTIVLTLDGALTRVTATDIVLVESDGAYSKVTLATGQTCLVHKGIDQWEQLLPKPAFVRIDRFHIFQLASVTGVARESRDRSEVHLKGRAEPLALARVASVRLRTLIKASG
jgi:two-component system LytT family response regulator